MVTRIAFLPLAGPGRSWRGLAAANAFALVLVGAPVLAADALGPFDFAYRISGDRGARPVQVFDNGTDKTYFQFPAGATVPLILVDRGPDIALPTAEGPYHTVAGRARAYSFVLAGHAARAEHALRAPPTRDAMPLPVLAWPGTGAARPFDRTLSSHATPLRGDVIEWREPQRQRSQVMKFLDGRSPLDAASREALVSASRAFGPAALVRIATSGGDARDALASQRVERVRRTLLGQGIPPAHITVSAPLHEDIAMGALHLPAVVTVEWRGADAAETPLTPADSAASASALGRSLPGHFDLLAADGTVSASLRRWARSAGYRIDWAAPFEAPLTGDLTLDATRFTDAVDRVMTGLQASGYPLHLEATSDRVLRVVQTP